MEWDFAPILIGYLSGSIPFALIYGYLFSGKDIRRIGSGNVGATNAFRLGGWKLSLITFLSDFLKAMIPTLFFPKQALWVSIASIVGHIFPVWLRFRGGKGVSCLLGATLALSPLLSINLIFVWISLFYSFRVSGTASIIMACCLPFLSGLYDGVPVGWSIAASVLILCAHASNIRAFMYR